MVSFKKTDKSDYKWLRFRVPVTMSDYKLDYEWLRVRLRVTKSDYKWLQVTTSQKQNTAGSQMISYNCRQETSSNS